MDYQKLIDMKPYEVSCDEKEKMLLSLLKEVTRHHFENCIEYRRFLKANAIDLNSINSISELPYLPIGVFKDLDLKSIKDEDVFKVLTSSGTSLDRVSRVYLDRDTASWQQKTLLKIMEDYIGDKRIPFLIVDSKSVLKDRKLFSARGAAILGFSIFASSVTYALDEDMNVDFEAIDEFLLKNEGKKTVVFGFTFMIWDKLIRALKEKNRTLNLEKSIVLHGGGWKRLIDSAVTSEEYKDTLKRYLNVENVYNYYGMAEQTGSIYMECECGNLHASTYSDILIRDMKTLKPVSNGEEGLIEVVSPFPMSYPGHALLTEDIGIVLGEDDCPCGRKGKYFKVNGRVKKAVIRGCSDTHG